MQFPEWMMIARKKGLLKPLFSCYVLFVNYEVVVVPFVLSKVTVLLVLLDFISTL